MGKEEEEDRRGEGSGSLQQGLGEGGGRRCVDGARDGPRTATRWQLRTRSHGCPARSRAAGVALTLAHRQFVVGMGAGE